MHGRFVFFSLVFLPASCVIVCRICLLSSSAGGKAVTRKFLFFALWNHQLLSPTSNSSQILIWVFHCSSLKQLCFLRHDVLTLVLQLKITSISNMWALEPGIRNGKFVLCATRKGCNLQYRAEFINYLSKIVYLLPVSALVGCSIAGLYAGFLFPPYNRSC